MEPKAGYWTPMLHVKSIEESMQFYRLLGFETMDQMGGDGCLGWARMHCEGGALMFLRAEEGHSPDPAQQGVMFFLYTPELAGLREHLLASGVQVPPIQYPEYASSGEINLRDPDGYAVSVCHWGQKEHEQWEQERKIRIGRG